MEVIKKRFENKILHVKADKSINPLRHNVDMQGSGCVCNNEGAGLCVCVCVDACAPIYNAGLCKGHA